MADCKDKRNNEAARLSRCANCGKELTPDMELEYSEWLCEAFCTPDCATAKYYDRMGSRIIEWEELVLLRGGVD